MPSVLALFQDHAAHSRNLFEPDRRGVRPELLSGEEEARLEFLGAVTGLDEPAPYLVLDVGGGSTEFIAGTREPEGLCSIDIGCVRLTEQFLHGDPPTPEELSQAVTIVRDHLADVDRLVPGAAAARTLVGTAGTVWTLAAIELGVDASRSDRIDHRRIVNRIDGDRESLVCRIIDTGTCPAIIVQMISDDRSAVRVGRRRIG